jgi:hypothetical protein
MVWKYDGKAVNINKGFVNADGYTSPKNWYTAWDDKLKKAEGLVWEAESTPTETAEQKLEKLREVRNRLLLETDWWGCSDQTMSSAQTKYRQDLRDITKTYKDLASVKFPTKP